MSLATIAAACSDISSILSLAVSVKKLAEKLHISPSSAYDKVLEKFHSDKIEHSADLSDQQFKEAVLSLMIISADLLEALLDRARECQKNHIKDIKAGTDDDYDIGRRAEDCMCGTLKMMKRYNGNVLPDDITIQNWWKSYRCS